MALYTCLYAKRSYKGYKIALDPAHCISSKMSEDTHFKIPGSLLQYKKKVNNSINRYFLKYSSF